MVLFSKRPMSTLVEWVSAVFGTENFYLRDANILNSLDVQAPPSAN